MYKSCHKVLTETRTWKQSYFSSHSFNQQCLILCDICHHCVQNYWLKNSIRWTQAQWSFLVKPESGANTDVLVTWFCSMNKALSTHNHHQHRTQLHSYTFRKCTVTEHMKQIIFFFVLYIFNWSIVDLQCCVNYCCTAKWFSYTYMHAFFFIFFSIMAYHRILNIVLCAIQ